MTGTHRSPGMRSVAPYPFEELDRRVARAAAEGRELIDFGVGDPREETPAFIREALVHALEPVSNYPRAAGLPELRDAIAAWVERRFGSHVAPDTESRPVVLAINTLSKRSSMTGYRSGFVAGDPALIADLKRLRPATGVTPQEFIQRASVAAWRDEVHVEENRARYRRKRDLLLEVFERHGVHVAGSVATFYLWVRVPTAETSLEWALRLLDRGGVVVAPGSFFGPDGEGFVRMAMVPPVEACERAASTLDELLAEVRT